MVVKHPSLPIVSVGNATDVAPAPALAQAAASAATKTKPPPSELLVMGRIERLVSALPEGVRGRVVRWAYEKWCADGVKF